MLLLATACEDTTDAPQSATQWMLQHTDDYLHDTQWRRAELEDSLWRPELPYAQKRLDAYALPSGGWDALPEFQVNVESVGKNPKTITVTNERPTTQKQWLELGEQIFWYMPMRRDPYLEWIATQPQLWNELGLQSDSQGNLLGLVRYKDPLGRARVAVTCGFCHHDNGRVGAANSHLDLGRARAMFGSAVGQDWPTGTVDVTDDHVNDPVAIPDLFNVEHQAYINHAASVRVASPASLAIRFESQFIEGQSMMARPSRAQVWALTMFVVSLDSDTQPNTELPGFNVFQTACASCHQPEHAFGGTLSPPEAVNSDPTVVHSPMRGTGYFKVPTLLGASKSTTFMNDASLHSLEDVLRTGHPTGETLPENDLQNLLQFLNTL